jgi:hypothetical protein
MTSKTLFAVATRLGAVLDRENAALTAMDLPRAAALLAEKAAAIADLTASGSHASGLPNPGLLAIVRGLEGLARENRRLLERAIMAQERVIGIVARAAVTVSVRPSYGARGRRADGPAGPMTLSTRA